MKHGVPIDIAFALEPDEIMGWLIIFGEIEGGEFDWSTMSWAES